MTDNIKPNHYRTGEIDLYEAWYRTYPFNEYRAIMQAVAERYMRRDKNNRVEDLNKSIYTLERLKDKEIERAEKVEDKDKSQVELFHKCRKEYLEKLWSYGCRYITRDSDETLWAYDSIPVKDESYWGYGDGCLPIDEEYDFFPEIQWSDEEPTGIADLLTTYQNGGENGE